jgi:hypothetical protein
MMVQACRFICFAAYLRSALELGSLPGFFSLWSRFGLDVGVCLALALRVSC